jgi:tRNA (guanine-N7-)-methyltransferase
MSTSSNGFPEKDTTNKESLIQIAHPVVMADLTATPIQARPIRSFALRGGHMSEAQKRAYNHGMPKWSIGFEQKATEFNDHFSNAAPLILEIGFGMGETTAHIATAQPQFNFIGAEVYTSGVGSLLKHIEQKNLSNLRVIQHDAVEILQSMVAPNSLFGVHIFFPDPWHKARHNKRRLIQAPFASLVASRIQAGGYLHCATDWEPYANQMLEVLSAEAQFVNTAERFAPRPAYRPVTKFENRGVKLGHGVWDLVFKKV